MSFLLEAAGGTEVGLVKSLGDAGMGFLIVFIGLVCLIALVAVLGKVCQTLLEERPEGKAAPAAPVAAAAPAAPVAAAAPIENRDELVVAFSAAVAEELGTDVSAIRVVSFKEIG